MIHHPINPNKKNQVNTRIWRVGLLITTIVLGFLLVILGIIEFRTAKKNGARVTQAQVMYMMMGFQKQLRKKQEPNEELTKSLFEMLKNQGVHRVAVYEHGTLLHGFGQAQVPLTPQRFVPAFPLHQEPPPEPIQIQFVKENLIHAQVTLPARRPPPQYRMHRQRRMHDMKKSRSVLLEMRPKEAITLRNRAFRMMILDIVAAFILMGAAIVFWRQSVRQEQLQKQLEKDRQLKMLGQMSAVIGHELKNTIASIKGHSQLLAEKLVDSPNEPNATRIVKDAIYLQTLTEQMLDFSRTGTMNTEKVYVDDLTEAAITFSIAKNVDVELHVDVPHVFVDRHKMQQVLTNLLNNAQQANPQNISLSISSIQNRAFTIVVKDNGDGIADSELERIFDPFFTNRAQGTGLGLALAKQIIEAHGGTISVTSIPKQETTFTIELPINAQKGDLPLKHIRDEKSK